jgi:hypothetical protein
MKALLLHGRPGAAHEYREAFTSYCPAAGELPNGRYLHCPNGRHLAFYDDQKTFCQGLVRFIKDVDELRF